MNKVAIYLNPASLCQSDPDRSHGVSQADKSVLCFYLYVPDTQIIIEPARPWYCISHHTIYIHEKHCPCIYSVGVLFSPAGPEF